jgi:hypothetical protein
VDYRLSDFESQNLVPCFDALRNERCAAILVQNFNIEVFKDTREKEKRVTIYLSKSKVDDEDANQ